MRSVPHSELNQSLFRLRGEYLREVGKLCAVRWLGALLALALVFGLLDAWFGFPGVLRLLLDGLLVAGPLGVAIYTYCSYLASPSLERRVSRLVEQGQPELGNRLVNAIDFATELKDGAARETFAAELMNEEIVTASEQAYGLRDPDGLTPPSFRRESRGVLGLAGGSLLLAVGLWPVFLAVAPRFLMPLADVPPYSPTKLELHPKGIELDYGASLDIEATVAGKLPDGVTLHLEPKGDDAPASVAMHRLDDDKYISGLEHVTEDLVYYASVAGGRTPRYELTVMRTPRIDTMQVRYVYPKYTGLKPQTRYVAGGEIRGYRGTEVTLMVTANQPLRDGRIAINGAETVLLPGGDPATVEGRFLLEAEGSYTVSVMGQTDLPGRETMEGHIVLEVDKEPEVAVVSPGTDSFATPHAQVPINIEARDDLGVRRVELVRSHNGSIDSRKTLLEEGGAMPFANVVETLDLEDLGVKPGDVIEYYVTASDTAVDGPHSAATQAYQLMVISEEQYQDYLQTMKTADDLVQKYELFREQLEELAERQQELKETLSALHNKAAEEGGLSEASRLRMQDLEDAQRALAQQAGEVAEGLMEEAGRDPLYDIEKDLKEELKGLAQRARAAQSLMENSAEQMATAHQASDPAESAEGMEAAQNRQDQALSQLGQSQEEFSREIAQALEEIRDLHALREEVERFKYLLARQQSVARQSKTLAEQEELSWEDQVRLKELAEEQEIIRDAVEIMCESFRENSEKVEEAYPKVAEDGRELAARMEELKIADLMTGAAGAFAKVEAEPGHQQAQEAYDAMASMVSQCQSAGGNAQGQCEARLRIQMNKALGNTLEQLARSLRFGQNPGQGQQGGQGIGSMGSSGSVPSGSSSFSMYGDADLDRPTQQSSGLGRRDAKLDGLPEEQAPVALEVESVRVSEKAEIQIALPDGEPIMEEYRPVIVEYFRRLAEE